MLKKPGGTREGTTEKVSPVTSPTQPHSNRDLNIFPEQRRLKSNPTPMNPGALAIPTEKKAAISRFPQTPRTQSQGSLGLSPASIMPLGMDRARKTRVPDPHSPQPSPCCPRPGREAKGRCEEGRGPGPREATHVGEGIGGGPSPMARILGVAGVKVKISGPYRPPITGDS